MAAALESDYILTEYGKLISVLESLDNPVLQQTVLSQCEVLVLRLLEINKEWKTWLWISVLSEARFSKSS